MNKYTRVVPICFALLFGGIFAANAQSTATQGTPAQKAAHTYGTKPMLKSKAARHSRMASGKLTGEEFSSQMAAKAHCPTDTVVWANKNSRVFHLPKSKYYGKTKHGAYACEKAATTAGYRAAKG